MPANFSVRTRSTQLLTDQDGDNVADGGDVLRTTLTIHNTGTTALDVTIQDLLNGSTLNPGSIKIGPMAVDDVATISGNTPQVFTFAQLLGNDIDPDGSNATMTITGVSGANHGTVTIDTIAQTVTFVPETGYQGAASFQYSVADAQGLTNVAGFEGTVNVTISGQVWYVDANYAGANGAPDGSYLKPFTSLTNLNDDGTTGTGRIGPADGIAGDDDVDGANDTIFVYDRGANAVNGGITLEAGQKLFGDAHTFVVNGITIGATANQSTINSHSTNNTNYGVTLATNNEIRGINLDGDPAGNTVNLRDGGGTVGTLTITDSSITGTGQAVDIDQGGTLNVTLTSLSSGSSTAEGIHLAGTGANLLTGSFTANAGTIQTSTGTGVLIGISGGGTASSGGDINFTYGGDITSPGGSLVEIQDRTGGTVDFNGILTEGNIGAGQTGILIDGSAGTINFDGQTFVSAGGAAGNGVTLTNNTGTINFNATGTGLDITTAGGSGLTFTGGGTLNITGSANSVVTGTGQVLNLQNGAMGTSGIAFQTLTSGNVAAGNAININNIDAAGAGTFSGGAVTIGGTAGAGADGINITNSNSTFTFSSATIDNTQGDGIEINGQTQTQGSVTFTTVNIDGTTGSGVEIVGNTNAVNINGGTIGLTNDAAAETVLINGGTGNITINANLTNSTANVDIVDIANHTSGTIAFGGTISSTGGAGGIDIAGSGGTINFTGTAHTLTTGGNAAVNITTNSAAINFTGGNLDILTTGGAGLSANATGGSVTVTGTGNTVSTGAGTAVDIQGTDIGAGGVTFNTVNTSGAASGIILSNTGSGAFTVVGTTGVNGSGGSILNSTGHGINLTNTGPVSLTGVTITGSGGSGINGSGTTGLSLTNVTSSTNGNAVDEGGVFLLNASGNMFVTNSTFNANADDNFAIRNDTGSLNLTVTGSTFSNSYQGAFGDDNLILQANNTANITALITTSTFTNAEGDHFNFATNASASGSSNITFTDNTLSNNQPAAVVLGSGVTISPAGSADLNVLIAGNTITDTISGFSINVNAIDTTNLANIQVTIEDNDIGTAGVNGSGPEQSGAIQTRITGSGTMTALIDNNRIHDWGNGSAIDVSAAQGTVNGNTALLNVTIQNNVVNDPNAADPNLLRSLMVTGGASAGVSDVTIRAEVQNNDLDTAVGVSDTRFIVHSNSEIQSPGYAGGPADGAAFAAFIAAQNPAGGTVTAGFGSTPGTYGNTPGGAAVPLPSDPTLPPPPMMLAPEPPLTPPADDGDGKHAGDIPPPTDDGDTGTGTGTGTGGKDDHSGDLPGDNQHPVIVDDGMLSQAELDYLVDAAIQRWIDAGASPEQVAAMRAAAFSVADMTGVQLGMSDGSTIYVDNDGGRAGWFLDTTPGADEEYAGTGTRLTATGGAAAQGVDLLTVLMHELGHQAGLGDTYNIAARDDLMYGYAYEGERRLPADGQAAGAVPGSIPHPVFQLGPVVVGTVPGDNAFVVQYDSTVNTPTEDRLVQSFSNDADISWRDVPAGTLFTASTNSETLAVDTLTLGNLIYFDANANGIFDAGDTGIAGVTLTLYADTDDSNFYEVGVDQPVSYIDVNSNGVFDPAVDTPAAAGTPGAIALTTMSDANGFYSFNNLAAGNYIVVVNASNFLSGGALEGLQSVFTLGFGGSNPNDNTDNINDGRTDDDINPYAGFVASMAIRLDGGMEPTDDGDTDPDTNLTLDFGFFQANQPPVFTNLDGDNQTYTEGGGAIRIDVGNNLAISDPDSPDGNFDGGSLTLTLTGGVAGDVLALLGPAVSVTPTGNPNEFNVAVNGTTIGVMTASATSLVTNLNADATTARVQELARSFAYIHVGDNPTTATRSFTFTLVDGDGTANGGDDSGTATATIQVVPVNDEPIGDDNSDTTDDLTTLVFDAANFNTNFQDPDNNNFAGVVITTLPPGAQGEIRLNGVAIAPGQFVTVTQLNNGDLTFVPVAGQAGTSPTFTFQVRDDGGVLNGGQDTDQSPNTFTINLTVPNAAPVLDLDADDSNSVGTGFTASYTEGGAAAAISDTDVSITDADVGDDIVSATITITNAETGDVLTIVGALPAGLSLDGGSTATNIIITGTGTAADYQAAIEQITFSNTGDNPTDGGTNTSRSISVVVNDGVSNSNVATATIAVTDDNADAPSGTNATITAIEDTFRLLSAGDLGFSDVDGTFASVTISAVTGGDLYFDADGTAGGGAPVLVGSLPQTYTAQDLIDGKVSFRAGPNANGAGLGTITFTVTDDDGNSAASANTLTVDVTAVNDAPALTTGGPFAATEQTAVAILPAGSVADADLDARNGGNGDYAGATFSVNRNPAANAEDLFSLVAGPNFTIDGNELKAGGLVFATFSTGLAGTIIVSFTSSQATATSALANEVIQAVRYTNSSDNPPASVNLAVGFTDGSPGGGQGTGGSGLDVNLVTVNIAGVNDAPVNSLGGTIGTGEDAIDAWLSGMSISDPDANPATDIISVTFVVANGTLDIRTDVLGGVAAGDVTGDDTGTITVLATLNAINATLAASNGLTYTPNANFNGDDTLTVTTNDQGANGSGGAKVDIDVRTISVSPQPDAPVAQPDAVSTPENVVGTGSLFANNGSGPDTDADGDTITISEVNGSSANVGVEITLASGAKLTVNANGTYSYNPNGKFNYLTDNTSGAVNTSTVGDTFQYTVTGGNTVTVTVTVNGVAGSGDLLFGDGTDNTITGTPQGDQFRLQQGGNDTVFGLGAADGFYFGGAFNANDSVNGGGGNDVLVLQGNYGSLTFGTGTTSNITSIEAISLVPGNLTTYGDTANNFYDYNLTMLDANVAAGTILKINGHFLRIGEDFTFNGAAETNGSFTIFSGMGVENLTGGALGDLFIFGHDGRFGAGDVVNGGGGYDVFYLRGDYTIDFNAVGFAGSLVNMESIGLVSGTDVQFVTGGDGQFDYDLTWNDSMLGAGLTLAVNGSRLAANETMTFDGSQETNGHFRIFGGAADDVLRGGGGNDLIYGGLGADTLQGGGGNDIFRYQSAAESTPLGRDGIQDFALGDLIDLLRVDANSNLAGDQAFNFIGGGAFTNQAGQLRAENTVGPIWTVSGDTNGDGVADFEVIVVVADSHPLTGGDFIL